MTEPLSKQMLLAAEIIERFNTELADVYQQDASWRPSELRREAVHREAEEREAAERDVVVEELARDWFTAGPSVDKWPGHGADYYRGIARKLVESGWRKETLT